MDLPPLPRSPRRLPPREVSRSFNPCCGGSASSAIRAPKPAGLGRQVSILVVVDLPPLLGIGEQYRRVANQFQSLLFWISPRDWMGARVRKIVTEIGGFQSLLFWIYVLRPAETAPLHQSLRSLMSILVVLDLRPPTRGAGAVDPSVRLLVSILVVLDHVPLRPGSPLVSPGKSPSRGFDPCCSGSRPPTRRQHRRQQRLLSSFNPCCKNLTVHVLRPASRGPCGRGSKCFNPCCSGSRPPTWAGTPTGHSTCRGFNPCCSGSTSSDSSGLGNG